jgi:hypothetical protein
MTARPNRSVKTRPVYPELTSPGPRQILFPAVVI